MATTTDISERGLERLICTALTGQPCDPLKDDGKGAEPRAGDGGVGWICGHPHDYDREFCVDRVQLAAFLHSTQPEAGCYSKRGDAAHGRSVCGGALQGIGGTLTVGLVTATFPTVRSSAIRKVMPSESISKSAISLSVSHSRKRVDDQPEQAEAQQHRNERDQRNQPE